MIGLLAANTLMVITLTMQGPTSASSVSCAERALHQLRAWNLTGQRINLEADPSKPPRWTDAPVPSVTCIEEGGPTVVHTLESTGIVRVDATGDLPVLQK